MCPHSVVCQEWGNENRLLWVKAMWVCVHCRENENIKTPTESLSALFSHRDLTMLDKIRSYLLWLSSKQLLRLTFSFSNISVSFILLHFYYLSFNKH